MISHTHRFIFLHVPKSGGTSVARTLPGEDYCTVEERQPHGTLRQYYAKYGKALCDSYFKFSIVRSPWDRLVSLYHFNRTRNMEGIRRNYPQLVEQYTYAIENDFETWLRKPLFIDRQMYFLTLDEDFVHSRTHHLDFVGRFERLQQDFDTICDRLGLQRQLLPNIRHNSSHPHYTELYTPELAEIVARDYAQDLEVFGFRFPERSALSAPG